MSDLRKLSNEALWARQWRYRTQPPSTNAEREDRSALSEEFFRREGALRGTRAGRRGARGSRAAMQFVCDAHRFYRACDAAIEALGDIAAGEINRRVEPLMKDAEGQIASFRNEAQRLKEEIELTHWQKLNRDGARTAWQVADEERRKAIVVLAKGKHHAAAGALEALSAPGSRRWILEWFAGIEEAEDEVPDGSEATRALVGLRGALNAIIEMMADALGLAPAPGADMTPEEREAFDREEAEYDALCEAMENGAVLGEGGDA